MSKPTIIKGDNFIDYRGRLNFCNDMDFSKVKRFYEIVHDKDGQRRGLHGHLIEEKWMRVTQGTFQVLLAPIVKIGDQVKLLGVDHWEVLEFTLSEYKPQILHIPNFYANGIRNLTTNAKMTIYSSVSIEEAKNDDYRFNCDDISARCWEPKEH